MNKKTWEDIIIDVTHSSNTEVKNKVISQLMDAEADGIVCINPPSVDEIFEIMHGNCPDLCQPDEARYEVCKEIIAKAIHKRITGQKNRRRG